LGSQADAQRSLAVEELPCFAVGRLIRDRVPQRFLSGGVLFFSDLHLPQQRRRIQRIRMLAAEDTAT
jgi:hypothetical protein